MPNPIADQITNQMLELSLAVVKYLEASTIPLSIRDQLIKSITSIGANYSEAQNAASKKDFINKIYIAKKEAAESVYWLNLVQKLENSNELAQLQDKAQRFVMILQKTINSSRSPRPNDKGKSKETGVRANAT